MQIRKNHTPSKVEKFFMAIIEAVIYAIVLAAILAILAGIGRGIFWLITGA